MLPSCCGPWPLMTWLDKDETHLLLHTPPRQNAFPQESSKRRLLFIVTLPLYSGYSCIAQIVIFPLIWHWFAMVSFFGQTFSVLLLFLCVFGSCWITRGDSPVHTLYECLNGGRMREAYLDASQFTPVEKHGYNTSLILKTQRLGQLR
jgi:hypothetical protein